MVLSINILPLRTVIYLGVGGWERFFFSLLNKFTCMCLLPTLTYKGLYDKLYLLNIQNIYQELIQLNIKTTITITTLWIKKRQRTQIGFFFFFQRKGPEAHKKMFAVSNHQGKANQNHGKIAPCTCQNSSSQKDNTYQVLARTWRKGNFPYCWWECKLVQSLWKTVRTFLKKIKNRTTIWSSNSTPLSLSMLTLIHLVLLKKD